MNRPNALPSKGKASLSRLPIVSSKSAFKSSIPSPRRSRSLIRSSSTLSTTKIRRSASQTPRNVGCERSRSKSTQRKMKPDPRPTSNKVWQAQQSAQVEEYLREIGASQYLNNGLKLRPLTLSNFVEITNLLLEPLLDTEPLNTVDYVERLPQILKMLSYPGTVSASCLKTANTLHSWPSILAVLSWLYISGTIVSAPMPDFFDSPAGKEENMFAKYILKGFQAFNNDQPLDDVLLEYERELDHVYGIGDDFAADYERRMCKVEEEQRELDRQEAELDEEMRVLNERHDKLKQAAEKEERCIEEMERRNLLLQQRIISKAEHRNERGRRAELVKQEISKLDKELGFAPSQHDVADLTARNVQLKKRIMSREKDVETNREGSHDMDINLAQLRAKLQDKIKQWNASLCTHSLKCPELESLMIWEKNDMNVVDMQTLHSISQNKKNITRKFCQTAVVLKKEKHQIQEEIDEVLENKRKEEDELKKLRDLACVKGQQVEELKQRMEQVIEGAKSKAALDEQILQDKLKLLSELKEEAQRLQVEEEEKQNSLEQRRQRFAQHTEEQIKFFEAIQNRTVNAVEDNEELMKRFTLKQVNELVRLVKESGIDDELANE